MQKPILYTDLARYYDLTYSWKDYRKEAVTIRRLIAKYKRSKGNDLLEVACGTGRHSHYLKDKFRVLGTLHRNQVGGWTVSGLGKSKFT